MHLPSVWGLAQGCLPAGPQHTMGVGALGGLALPLGATKLGYRACLEPLLAKAAGAWVLQHHWAPTMTMGPGGWGAKQSKPSSHTKQKEIGGAKGTKIVLIHQAGFEPAHTNV